MRPTSPATALALGVLGVALGVLAGEVALRAAGFEFRAFAVQFAQPPRKIEIHYQPDPDLFWVTRDYSLRLAQARRMERPVVFMGDSLPEYRSNLETIVSLCRQGGAQAVLITAPSGHVRGREPPSLLERRLRRLEDLVPTHKAYVEATLEAARAFLDRADRAEEDFMKDGVHLKESGNQFLAGLVADCISSALDSLRPER